MKYLYISVVFIFIICCSFVEKNIFLDYFNSDKDTTLITEFTHYTSDTTIERVFLKVRETKYKNSIILSNVLFNKNGASLSSGIEYFYLDNSYQLVSHTLYELDSLGNSIEVKGIMLNNEVQSFSTPPLHYTLMYKFRSDSAMTFRVEIEIYAQEQFVDSLKDNCLFVNSIEKTTQSFSDGRVEKKANGKTSRVYAKGKGLIWFEYDVNGVKKDYVLTKKYYR